MGCASSKKTKTVSVEDLSTDKHGSNKNGQLAANDAKLRGAGGDASKAIQIPGAHTSFMAPDGIPFIDEDVDEDAETRGTAVVGNATTSKADVNRNVVQAETKSSASPVADVPPPARPVSVEEEKKREIGAEIMKREIEITQNVNTMSPPTTSEGVRVEHVVVTTTSETHTVVNGLKPISEEEQEQAAIRIQAGIRGYRDRQRVKAIRRASQQQELLLQQQPPHEEPSALPPIADGEQPLVDGPAPDSAEHDSIQVTAEHNDSPESEHQLELDRAAVRIQASYKGYKTRKSLGKI